jgi:hypothetical protein
VKDRETVDAKRIRKPKQRVFSHSVDKAATIDKIVINATGKLNETFREDELVNVNPKAIFHPGGHYAVCIFGDWRVTKNPVSIHHIKMVKFDNVPELRFTMQSDNVPLTAAHVYLLTWRCTCEAPELTVSSVELTFDFTGTSIDEVGKQLIHRAERVRILEDERGWQTIYVGSPRSAWQVRIYQKTESVVRLEFVLRRGFLYRHGINRPEDVLLLLRIKIWELLSLRRFSRSRAERVTRNWQNQTARRLVLDWFKDGRPKESLLQVLKGNRVQANSIFRKTSLQRRLEAMQRRLIW